MTKKFFKSTEEAISMFLGLIIVVIILVLIFNFVKERSGNISLPGVSTTNETEEIDDGVYIVAYNDSLWKIAEKIYNSGYKWVDIAKENRLENPGLLRVGQKLVLPKIDDFADEEIDYKNDGYTVLRNDSLWKISVKLYGDGFRWTEIWQNNKNKIRNPNKLEIGMKLMVE